MYVSLAPARALAVNNRVRDLFLKIFDYTYIHVQNGPTFVQDRYSYSLCCWTWAGTRHKILLMSVLDGNMEYQKGRGGGWINAESVEMIADTEQAGGVEIIHQTKGSLV